MNQTYLPFIITITIVLFVWNAFLQIQFFILKKNLRILFQGRKAADIEEIIFEQIKRLRVNEENLKELNKLTKELEKMASSSIQKIGLVRFNPFSNTGSDQSFCLALLDASDNGFVISSLFNRETTRIYAKPIENSDSKYPLSNEEKEAIKKAKA